jgi:diadenosine tetraphosphate (Ap4A) HIT family hydrolase
LAADSAFICELQLCQVRVILDANYPWFLLIPQINGLKEPHQLSSAQQHLLTNESRMLSLAIEICFSPVKLNIASIGNMVGQLHVHHIARFEDDVAWPKPVWGFTNAAAYEAEALKYRIELVHGEITKQLGRSTNNK